MKLKNLNIPGTKRFIHQHRSNEDTAEFHIGLVFFSEQRIGLQDHPINSQSTEFYKLAKNFSSQILADFKL